MCQAKEQTGQHDQTTVCSQAISASKHQQKAKVELSNIYCIIQIKLDFNNSILQKGERNPVNPLRLHALFVCFLPASFAGFYKIDFEMFEMSLFLK